jgi:hypothetical protein
MLTYGLAMDDLMSLNRNVLSRIDHYQVSILIWTWMTLWCRYESWMVGDGSKISKTQDQIHAK